MVWPSRLEIKRKTDNSLTEKNIFMKPTTLKWTIFVNNDWTLVKEYLYKNRNMERDEFI